MEPNIGVAINLEINCCEQVTVELDFYLCQLRSKYQSVLEQLKCVKPLAKPRESLCEESLVLFLSYS